jgi:hypothetical protein
MSWREQANLLLANGHPHVHCYPLCEVAAEAARVRKRTDLDLAIHMKVLQEAVASVLSEKAGKAFKKTLKALTPDTD